MVASAKLALAVVSNAPIATSTGSTATASRGPQHQRRRREHRHRGGAGGGHRPQRVGAGGVVERDQLHAQRQRGRQRQRHPRPAHGAAPGRRLPRDQHHPGQRARDPGQLPGDGRSPVTSPATTGTTALVARIGAATLMAPTDIER